jgi:hypothetical protein
MEAVFWGLTGWAGPGRLASVNFNQTDFIPRTPGNAIGNWKECNVFAVMPNMLAFFLGQSLGPANA